MHSVKLNIDDSIYNHIMFLLKGLKTDKLEIVEDEKTIQSQNIVNNIKTLFKDKNITLFKTLEDPMKWQEEQREEW